MIRITTGDFEDPRALDLLIAHLTTARAETARGSAHALDAAGLQPARITCGGLCRPYRMVPLTGLQAMQWLRFERLRWDKGQPEPAAYWCEACE